MTIRTATQDDFQQILQIYAYARAQMKQNGNPTQWGDSWPPEAILQADIQAGQSHVIETDSRICGVFVLLLGEEPNYRMIEKGHWLNDAPYGTIHRLAGNGTAKGIFRQCLTYCMSQIPNIRIDTHRDNTIMQHLLDQNGFRKCGIIYVEDGSPRIAYQRCL